MAGCLGSMKSLASRIKRKFEGAPKGDTKPSNGNNGNASKPADGPRADVPNNSENKDAAATPITLPFSFVNSTASANVYATITGTALDGANAGKLFLLSSDGKTPYFPPNPSSTMQPISQAAVKLGAPGAKTTVTIPHLGGARIYFSIDTPLKFFVNPGPNGPALVEPAVTNPSDPNIDIDWGFAEFTYNDQQVFVNISYVDFVALPIALQLKTVNGAHDQQVRGMPASGLDTICNQLRAQDASDNAGWSKLIVQRGGKNIRALSPNLGMVTDSSLFKNYYDSYVDAVYNRFASQPLKINTQAQWGTVSGTTSANKQQIVFGNQSFARPSTGDIFSCNSGPFTNTPDIERGAITARFSAAFNRSTLLTQNLVPETAGPAVYYKDKVTNHYSRIVHSVNADGRGYAFPYDDVAPDGGVDQSGSVFAGDPTEVIVTVGGQNFGG